MLARWPRFTGQDFAIDDIDAFYLAFHFSDSAAIAAAALLWFLVGRDGRLRLHSGHHLVE